MPEMTGWEVAEAVKARWPELPVGIVTGWGEEDLTREDRSRANFFLSKPFDRERIKKTLSMIHPHRAEIISFVVKLGFEGADDVSPLPVRQVSAEG